MSMRNPLLSAGATASVVVLATVVAVFGQQSAGQQTCLNKLNKDGSGVAKQQGKENVGCVKAAGTGQLLGSAQICLTADAKGKVQKTKDKTSADDAAACGTQPSFSYTGAAATNSAAVQGEVDLVGDVFGGDLDSAVISCDPNKAGCKCQQKVLGDIEKLADAKLKEFVNCKKAALKGGANSATALRDCVNNAATPGSIAADSKGKLGKAASKIGSDIVKSCDTPGVTGAFPGDCSALSGTAQGACFDQQVECRVCQIINEMDGLFVNCDLFDDGMANATCASGSGPTPTPTATATPVPTPTATFVPGVVLQGVLPKTNGRFNYNLTLGIPGSDAACNTNFPGSHTCTFTELQNAQAAGDLDGARDINGNTVTSFWAIDSSHAITTQCNDKFGSTKNWEYSTAHTGVGGEGANLDNAAGTLGPVTGGLICSALKWVGCCL